MTVALMRHPGSADAVREIGVRVLRTPAGLLRLSFRLVGDLAELRIPTPRPPHRARDLWRHTCFEAFIRVEGDPAYQEFNFSPSREWATFGFRRYRDEMPLGDDVPAPSIDVRRKDDRLELDAAVALDPLSPLRVALAAVVETRTGALAYWALHHASGPPDFHHADAFALRLEPPGAAC